MNLKSNFVCLLALVMPMAACFAPAVTAAEAGDPVAGSVRLNQLGYLPGAKKLAVLPGSNSDSFSIIDTRTGKMVLEGKQGSEAVWTPSGERVRVADISTITAP